MKKTPEPKPRKTPKARKPKKLSGAPLLVERTSSSTHFIAFPHVKGRTVEKVEMSSALGHNAITIDFQDKTCLTLIIEPCFQVEAGFFNVRDGNQRVVQEWPVLHSTTEIGN